MVCQQRTVNLHSRQKKGVWNLGISLRTLILKACRFSTLNDWSNEWGATCWSVDCPLLKFSPSCGRWSASFFLLPFLHIHTFYCLPVSMKQWRVDTVPSVLFHSVSGLRQALQELCLRTWQSWTKSLILTTPGRGLFWEIRPLRRCVVDVVGILWCVSVFLQRRGGHTPRLRAEQPQICSVASCTCR